MVWVPSMTSVTLSPTAHALLSESTLATLSTTLWQKEQMLDNEFRACVGPQNGVVNARTNVYWGQLILTQNSIVNIGTESTKTYYLWY